MALMARDRILQIDIYLLTYTENLNVTIWHHCTLKG